MNECHMLTGKQTCCFVLLSKSDKKVIAFCTKIDELSTVRIESMCRSNFFFFHTARRVTLNDQD